MSWVGELVLNIHNRLNNVHKIKSTLQKSANPLRIGILAAAEINYSVIIDTTQTHPDTLLVAIAARSKPKAEAQIAKYSLQKTCRAYGSYDDLLADKSIDAVYIPTPNGLHAIWAIKAMEAGKHVLIEKPVACNGDEVRSICECSLRTGKIAVEALHWRFHPAAHHCKAIVESGKYGAVTAVHARFEILKGFIGKDDIRLKYDLGGGSCLDLIYTFSACWYFATRSGRKWEDQYECRIMEAKARLWASDSDVDEAMTAKFTIEPRQERQHRRPLAEHELSVTEQKSDIVSAAAPATLNLPVLCTIENDLRLSPAFFGLLPKMWRLEPMVKITLEGAEIEFSNFASPFFKHAITIREKDPQTGKFTGKKTVEKCYKDGPVWGSRGEEWWPSYRYQLEAFVHAVRAKDRSEFLEAPTGPWVSLEESEHMLDFIDCVYEKAGLPRRGHQRTG